MRIDRQTFPLFLHFHVVEITDKELYIHQFTDTFFSPCFFKCIPYQKHFNIKLSGPEVYILYSRSHFLWINRFWENRLIRTELSLTQNLIVPMRAKINDAVEHIAQISSNKFNLNPLSTFGDDVQNLCIIDTVTRLQKDTLSVHIFPK